MYMSIKKLMVAIGSCRLDLLDKPLAAGAIVGFAIRPASINPVKKNTAISFLLREDYGI